MRRRASLRCIHTCSFLCQICAATNHLVCSSGCLTEPATWKLQPDATYKLQPDVPVLGSVLHVTLAHCGWRRLSLSFQCLGSFLWTEWWQRNRSSNACTEYANVHIQISATSVASWTLAFSGLSLCVFIVVVQVCICIQVNLPDHLPDWTNIRCPKCTKD